MSEKPEIDKLIDNYRDSLGYVPPIRWYQVWRFHKVFQEDYAESRCADHFVTNRGKGLFDE